MEPDVGRENIFRSAPMVLVQLFVGGEVGRDVVGALGQLGLVQFRNLNADKSSFQQSFVSELRRLDEVSRQLRLLERHISSSGIAIPDVPDSVVNEALAPTHEIDELIERIATVSDKVERLATSREGIERRRDNLIEKRHVFRAADEFFMGKASAPAAAASARRDDIVPLLAEEGRLEFDEDEELTGTAAGVRSTPVNASKTSLLEALSIPVLAGTISRQKYQAFERLSWRVSRGNVYTVKYPIEQPINGEYKDVFIAYTHGDQLAARVRSVAESMDAHLFKVDNDGELRHIEMESINAQLNEVFSVLDSMGRTLEVESVTVSEQLEVWKTIIRKEQAVYESLNHFNFDHGRRSLIAEGWAPKDDVSKIQATLQRITEEAGISTPAVVHEIHTNRRPPTFHRTNKFTSAFQAIVDVYGIATYQEVNPGLPAVVTFPFMFAIMFGDIGHGIILGLAALTLVLREKAIARMKRDEIFDMAFGGRYVLLLMGVFSIFTGFLYNDIFSKSMTLFKSGWEFPKDREGPVTATFNGSTYPIGLDWGWHGSDNNLLFTNSYKMKLSILIGFSHMTYSLFFQYANARHFDSWVDIVGNFIPGLLFMQSIFGYLVLMIIYKWCVDWIGKGWEAPGLLNMLINMFLSPGNIDIPLYRGQAVVQSILVLIALICVPWLLLFKPLYLRKIHQKTRTIGTYAGVGQQAQEVFALDDEDDEHDASLVIHDSEDDHHEEFEFSEVMIHQVIHTIEFCLNCVSHTASYLRLWALSLAHNQLSSVLWNMTIQNAFGPTGVKGVIMVVCLFAMWFVGTVVVLVCMEGTSAMLHSLRLHWVEAMSKHFEGEGHAFRPFSFKTLDL